MPTNINQRMAALERYARDSSKKINVLLWKQAIMESDIAMSKKQKFDLEEQLRQLQEANYELKDINLKNESVIMDLTVKTRKMVDIEHLLKSLMEKTENVADIENRIKRLTEEREHIPEVIAKIDNMASNTEKLNEMKSDITRLSQETRVIPVIEADVKRLVTETDQKVSDMKYDIRRLAEDCHKVPIMITEIQRLTTKTEKIDDLESNLKFYKRESKKITEVQNQVASSTMEVEDLKRRTNQIDIKHGSVRHSITSVFLKRQENLTIGQPIKVDQFDGVNVNRGMFNQYSCNLVPPFDGVFCILLHTAQTGDGIIDMWLRWDGIVRGHRVGRTTGHGEECSGVTCVYLNRGQNAWVEAERMKGDADVMWCRLMCWQID